MSQNKKYAVLIGINEVPGTSYLSTPVSYAIKMNEWALKQQFSTMLFVDEDVDGKKRSVNIAMIYDAIETILNENPQQLLIYFAGHGIEKSAGNDIWLLPGYRTNTNEAINLYANKQLAYEAGPDHVIFISDSCRNPDNSEDLRHVNGSVIFPRMRRRNYKTEIDILYSTWPGQISVDYRDPEGNYKSVYSECLLECLNGGVSEVVRQLQNIHPTFQAVVPDDLNIYLKDQVPKLMAEVGINQHPKGEVSSRDPIYLAQVDDRDSNVDKKVEDFVKEPPGDPARQGNEGGNIEHRLDYFMSNKVAGKNTNRYKSIIAELKNGPFFPLPYFLSENSTGFFISGLENPRIFMNSDFQLPALNVFDDKSAMLWQSTYTSKQDEGNATILVSSDKAGKTYPIKLLKNFACEIIFRRQELVSINYYPTTGFRRDEAFNYRREISRRKANIIVAAQNGIFQGSEEIGDYVRKYKSLDPILGLFAAYAYFQKGLYTDVNSVFRYMSKEPEPILPDVVLLNRLSVGDDYQFDLSTDMDFPMLTEGWSYLELLSESPLKPFSKFLCAGLWTSFTLRGREEIMSKFHFKEL